MRSFLVTLALFAFVCGVIFSNFKYINKTAEHITALVSEDIFTADPKAAIDDLEAFWQKSLPRVGLSVGYKELDRMSDLLLDLRTYFELGNYSEVSRIRVLIRETASEISRLEKISIENLL